MIQVEAFDSDRVVVSGSSIELLKLRAAAAASRGSDEFIALAPGKLVLPRSEFDWLASTIQDLVELPDELKGEVASLEEKYATHALARQAFLDKLEAQGIADIPDSWLGVLEDHQAWAVNAMVTPGLLGMCLFDEQGTGKTLTTVAAFDTLIKADRVDRLFVVAPKTLLGTWEKEFESFLPSAYGISKIQGSPADRQTSLYTHADVYLTTYDAVSADYKMMSSLLRTKRFMLVFDESFVVKNEAAKRSQAATYLRQSATISLLLCGTPAPNSSIDLVHQFNLADLGYTFQGHSFTGMDNPSQSIEALVSSRGTYIRRLKADVLPDLALKKNIIHEYDLNSRQLELYSEAKRELEIYLRTLDNKAFTRSLVTYFQKRLALLQICISPALIDADTWESGKYTALLEIARGILSDSSKKIVLWSSYTKSTAHLMSLFRDYNPVKVDGSVGADDRQSAIKRFQEDDSVRVFVGNPAAAGAGITLTRASDAIFVSLPNQAAHYMQSLDRIHRIGQEASEVRYHFLVARNTLELRELQRLSEKQTTQADLFKDSADKGLTLDQALSELSYE